MPPSRKGSRLLSREEFFVSGVEMFKKLLDRGEAGDNIGCLLRGVKRDEISRGQVSRNFSEKNCIRSDDCTNTFFPPTGCVASARPDLDDSQQLITIFSELPYAKHDGLAPFSARLSTRRFRVFTGHLRAGFDPSVRQILG